MENYVLDRSNRELAQELVGATERLVNERLLFLDEQREHMVAKNAVKAIDASIMKEITSDKRFGNGEARNAQLSLMQRSRDDYQRAIDIRNRHWVELQKLEINIERTNNIIKNLRVFLKIE